MQIFFEKKKIENRSENEDLQALGLGWENILTAK